MQSLLEQAIRAHEEGDLDTASRLYQSALQESPEQPRVIHLLGLIAFEKKAYPSALELFKRANDLAPHTPDIVFSLACAYHELGFFKEAINLYEEAIKLNPDRPEIFINLANAARSLQQYAFSESAFMKAPDCSLKWMNLALLYQEQGLSQKAEESYKKAISCPSTPAEAYFHFANFLRDTNRDTAAWTYYEKALELSENPAFYNSFAISLEKQDFDAARRYYEKAGDYPEAVANLGALYFKTGNMIEAEKLLRRAVALDPLNVSALSNLANFLMHQNLMQEALEYYRRAVLNDPTNPALLHNFGTFMRKVGDLEEAAKIYLKTLSIKEMDETHLNLASTLYELSLSKPDVAKELAKIWRKSFPDNPVAHYAAGVLLGEDFSRTDPGYLRKAFDNLASQYSSHILKVKYDLSNLLEEGLKGVTRTAIFDIGCGPGIYAHLLRPHASRLIGIDISSAMISEADKLNIYDDLIIGDFLTQPFLPSVQILIALEICCYLGPLGPFLKKASDCLPDGGQLFFTIELGDKVELTPSGRFRHDVISTHNLLAKEGFKIISETNVILREEFGQKVAGCFFVAQK